MDKNLEIVKSRQINANASKVWEILTETSSDWNGVKIETQSEWLPNSDIIFSFTWDGKEYADKGKIIRFDKEVAFSYTYWSAFSGLPDQSENYSKIDFSLQPNENGVNLKLTHSNFATETMYEHSDKNWEETLDNIKTRCEK